MKPGTALRHKIALANRLLERRTSELGGPLGIDGFLPEILFRTHCVARASAPLMRAALARAEELGATDAIALGICSYLREHIEEERAHADWVLEDLEAIGQLREPTLLRVPPTVVAELVGAQYYWIHHAHPVALLAYIVVLEQHVTPFELVSELMAVSRFPSAAFRTLLEHAQLDPDHVAKLYGLLDDLPLNAAQIALLSSNAFQTLALLERSFEEIFEEPSEQGAGAPARTP